MYKRNLRILVIFLFLCLIFTSSLFAQGSEESFVITTYYPSPIGTYFELRAKHLAIGPRVYDPAQYCWSPAVCPHAMNAATSLWVEREARVVTYDANVNPFIYVENRASRPHSFVIMGAGRTGTTAATRVPNPFVDLRADSDINPEPSPYIDFTSDDGTGSVLGDRNDFDARIKYHESNNFEIEAPAMFIWDRATPANLRFQIDTRGNVGIGSSAPLTKLYVMGISANNQHTAKLEGNNRYGVDIGGFRNNAGTNATFGSIQAFNAAAGAPLSINPNSINSGLAVGIGLVGVGVTPRYAFQVHSASSQASIHISGNDANQFYSSLGLNDTSNDTLSSFSNLWVVGHRSTAVASRKDNLEIGRYLTSANYIPYMNFSDDNGNVGIGTTNPNASAKLDIVDTGYIYASLHCRVVTATKPGNSAGGITAVCDSDEWVSGGGGSCGDSGMGSSGKYEHLYSLFAYNDGVTWAADCYRDDSTSDCPVTAYAICCKK